MKTLRRLFAFIKPYRGALAMAILCMFLFALFNTISIYTIKPIIDQVFDAGAGTVTYTMGRPAFLPERLFPVPLELISITMPREQMLLWIAGIIVLVFLFKGVASYGQAFFMGECGLRAGTDLRNQAYEHLLRQSLDFFDRRKTGDLISRLTGDIGIILNSISNIVSGMIREPASVIFLVALIFMLDWRLAAFSMVVFPLVAWIIAMFGRRMRITTHRMQHQQGEVSAVVMESISGIRVVQGFSMETYEARRHRNRTGKFLREAVRILRVKALAPPILELIAAVAIAGIVVYGGVQVIRGEGAGGMTTGTFFTFMAALISMYKPLRSLTQVNNTVQQIIAAGDRVFDILDAVPRVVSAPGAATVSDFVDSIAYRNVSFAYDTEPVLADISVTIERGQCVAIVGSSGAGKTTLVNMLPRFYDPTAGAVLLDGKDLRALRLSSLRRLIGIVTQEVVLFNDTVFNNIAYGLSDISLAEVENAARAANAEGFIKAMPNGYDTIIGERGMMLSGGERQRLSIARAILKNPPILLLDEATSSLDTESERSVQEALNRLMAERTTLVIAHRLSTITTADLILVLARGRVVERGTHNELLALNGTYKHLFDLQFRDDQAPRPEWSGPDRRRGT